MDQVGQILEKYSSIDVADAKRTSHYNQLIDELKVLAGLTTELITKNTIWKKKPEFRKIDCKKILAWSFSGDCCLTIDGRFIQTLTDDDSIACEVSDYLIGSVHCYVDLCYINSFEEQSRVADVEHLERWCKDLKIFYNRIMRSEKHKSLNSFVLKIFRWLIK